jgi:hypothetical protein
MTTSPAVGRLYEKSKEIRPLTSVRGCLNLALGRPRVAMLRPLEKPVGLCYFTKLEFNCFPLQKLVLTTALKEGCS